MTVYRKAAAAIAESPNYSCHEVQLQCGVPISREDTPATQAYQDVFHPGDLSLDRSKDPHFWWARDLNSWPEAVAYAKNARVIALLLAHEMALSGDIPL